MWCINRQLFGLPASGEETVIITRELSLGDITISTSIED
jgi:hypothetical protein